MKMELAIDTLLIAGPAGVPPVAADADTAAAFDIEAALSAPAAPYAYAQETQAIALQAPAPDPWLQGLAPEDREVPIGADSGILSLVTGLLLMMMLIVRRCRKLFGSLWQELLGMRRRANAFDDRTSGESSALTLMAVQWSVCAGILLYCAVALGRGQPIAQLVGAPLPEPPQARAPFVATSMLIGLAMAYYAAQLAAYWLLGYVFADSAGRRLYVQGFTASQSLLGFALLVPSLVAIFYQGAGAAMVCLGAVLYILARIIFIIKGFRIFYHNFGSSLYFILYLCAVEILPIILICRFAVRICAAEPMV